jgi:5'-methylthioadenosine phosphorylase
MNRPFIGIITGTGVRLSPDGWTESQVRTPYGEVFVQERTIGSEVFVHVNRHSCHRPSTENAWRLPFWIDWQGNGRVLDPRPTICALAMLGVRRILSTTAVGAITRFLPVGSIVFPDQLVTPSFGILTFADEQSGPSFHQPSAQPICTKITHTLKSALMGGRADPADWQVVNGGLLAIIRGPRFETEADLSQLRQADVIIAGMHTALPEAFLSLELGICYTMAGIVTDSPSEHPVQSRIEQIARLRGETLLSIFQSYRVGPEPKACSCNVHQFAVPGLRERLGIT